MSATQLVWLRNDLRLDDNPALYHAQQQGQIRVVFIATPKQWQKHDESAARLGLKAAVLKNLSTQLAEIGIQFDLIEVNLFSDIPATLLDFCQQHHLQTVWFNQETPLDEYNRDQAVSTLLNAHQIGCEILTADLIVSCPILNQQNEPYKVFTPYYRRWLQLLSEQQQAAYDTPVAQGGPLSSPMLKPAWAGDYREDLWPAEELRVLDKLDLFCDKKLQRYKDNRDFPAEPATSTLSPHLSLGQLGPRRLVSSIQFHCAQQQRDWHDDDWLRELAWRDFYRQLLLYFPDISKRKAFKPETEHVAWRQDDAGFEAWCQGKTGFPIIDAAMRQLLQTGWMHNRLRMLSASFLSKLLLIDWRRGERFFMQHLIDGDFAANNGGWQWSASTGVDAAPYFRVFSPIRQSEKFDPEGLFIKRFVAELSELPAKNLHWPDEQQRLATGYPLPIVDYKSARQRAIAAFANLPD